MRSRQQISQITEARLRELAENVFAYIQPDGGWFVNNCGVIVDPNSGDCLVVDSASTEDRTRNLIRTIRESTGHTASVLVNTHHHGDHTHGNYLFDNAVHIAHRLCREELRHFALPAPGSFSDTVDWGDIHACLPTVTFEESLTVHIGELACHLEHVGTAAHTTNDVVVWLPERSVLFAGDLLFNGGTPFVVHGSIEGSLAALRALRRYEAVTIVPGHGPVADASLIDFVESYLLFVQDLAADCFARGLAPLEAARQAELGEFERLLDSERLVGNLYRAYAEIEGRPRGCRLDDGRILADMVAFNGGRPLTCWA
ncbi:MBL fold metallo-hydrolase [Amycolatopsis thermalba]|uniref:MBL fold metallo-hydrolase n=1 Tax=Amycolatopsis thermalba TaxID=944492 RepID=A0ABY4P0W2_9PSEU|nr:MULTISPECIES: MBL fold metallo-hydrolase [Amycolatopsis]UQS25980.1 MBL fold metallo-hydrolase [Amycolatopsis thermalba]